MHCRGPKLTIIKSGFSEDIYAETGKGGGRWPGGEQGGMGLSGRGMHVQRPCGRKEEVNARCLESREHGQKGGMRPKRWVGPLRWDL